MARALKAVSIVLALGCLPRSLAAAPDAGLAAAFLRDSRGTVAGLPPAERRELEDFAKRNGCPCGCHMDLITCLASDNGCPLLKDHAQALAQALETFRAGRRPAPPRTPDGKPVPSLAVIEHDLALGLPAALNLYRAGKAFFVDARTPEPFAAGHAPGALNMPMRDFDAVLPRFAARMTPGMTAILYCPRGCEMSGVLAQKLIARGFRPVRVLKGGWDDWKAAGYPVERSP